MKIDSTEFGSPIIAGITYTHDLLIQLSGEEVKQWPKVWRPQARPRKRGGRIGATDD